MGTFNDNDEYEKICYICRRPESRAGKMVIMPGNLQVCPDCLQKAFDTVNNTNFDNGSNHVLWWFPRCHKLFSSERKQQ